MKRTKWLYTLLICAVIFASSSCLFGCGSSSSNGGENGDETGSTLTGDVTSFTASLATEKKSFFAQIKDFFSSIAYAAASGVTVTVGNVSAITDASGNFTLENIATGDQTVTFTEGSSSATYSLDGVAAGETFTLHEINVDGTTVSTAHTGTWTGTMTMDIFTGTPVEVDFTLTITAGGNSISGGMVIDEGGLGEIGTFSGTETGTILDARWTLTSPDSEGCLLSGPLTGTFDGNTLTGNEPIDDAGDCSLQPGDDDPDSHPFTLTKT